MIKKLHGLTWDTMMIAVDVTIILMLADVSIDIFDRIKGKAKKGEK